MPIAIKPLIKLKTPAPSLASSYTAPAVERYQSAALIAETELRKCKPGDKIDRKQIVAKIPETLLSASEAQAFVGFIFRSNESRFRVEKGVNGGTFLLK